VPVASTRATRNCDARIDASPRAGECDQQALGEQLPHQTRPAGAERRAYGELTLTRGSARQHQAGDVRTGDQQNDPDHAQHRQQPGANVAREAFSQRQQVDADARVARIEPHLLRGDPFQVQSRLRQRSPRSQPSDDVQEAMMAVGIDRLRQEQLLVVLLDM